TISLLGFKTITMTSFFIPILLLGIPILDTLFAIIRRTIKKEPISKPDKLHLHHQLLNLGLSHRNTVLAIYAMNILFAFASIIYALNDKTLGMIIYIIILLLIVFIITKTSIISDKIEKKGKK
ncbi:MAG: undecaprenyl/decaprenyl-phosphate alpha-N-acetylglucosaminyl 1-phosphate transferase, partial [Bacilli bacterium]